MDTSPVRSLRALVKRLVLFGPLDPIFSSAITLLDRAWGRVQTGPSIETTTRIGKHVITLPPHLPSYRKLLDGEYETEVTDVIRTHLSAGMTFVDLGANIGYFSLIASPIVGPGGHVYAFEPDPGVYEYLRRNVQANVLENVSTVCKAISDRVGSIAFVRSELERGHLTQETLPSSTSVDATTLDEFFGALGWPGVDLIKMDIEGGEASALDRMTELSRRNPNLKLIMEFNLTAIRRSGATPKLLAVRLKTLGFDKAQVIEQNLRPVHIGQSLPVSHAVYNLLLAK